MITVDHPLDQGTEHDLESLADRDYVEITVTYPRVHGNGDLGARDSLGSVRYRVLPSETQWLELIS